MPPRPAPSSARRGSSQRQESDEERAMKILERLAGAADLEAFDVEVLDVACLADAMTAAMFLVLRASSSSAAAPTPGAVPAVVAAALPAVARGMQLAAQQLDLARLRQHRRLAAHLMIMLASRCFALTPDAGSERKQLALSVLAVRAGLPKAHEQLSLRLTSIISDPAKASSAGSSAAQQQQPMQPLAVGLVTDHLELFTNMGWAWPGGPAAVFSPSLCQAVPAAAGLAVAALCHRDVLTDSPSEVLTSTWQASLSFACLLSDAYRVSGRSVPAQITGSGSVGTLLLVWLGLAAQRLHKLRRGLSPAAVGAAPSAAAAGASSAQQQQQQQQQRLAVPAHHTQLLQALDVAAGSVHPDSPLAAKAAAFWTRMMDMLVVVATAEQQQHLAAAAAAASCQQPLLLVLLECALLEPTRQLVHALATMLRRALAGADVLTAQQLGPSLLRAILQQDAGRRALEAATPAAAAPAAAAAAAAAAAPAAAVDDTASDNLSALRVLALLAMAANTGVLDCAMSRAADNEAFGSLLAGVAAVWLEHPSQFPSLLEAGLRSSPMQPALLPSVMAVARAGEAVLARLSTGGSAMATDSEQQVFALLLSCLKAVAAVAAAQGGSSSSQSSTVGSNTAQPSFSAADIAELAVVVLRAAVCVSGWCWVVPSSSDATSSSSSNQTSTAAPAAAADAAAGLGAQQGCVLLARCLVAAGRLMQLEAQAPASNNSPSSRHPLLESLLHVVYLALTLLGQQLAQQAAAAAEPWWQQLLDQHTQLQQQLESLQPQTAASAAASPQLPAAALAGIAEQLQAFGAAVCAALPVQQCCNHHDCRNMEQASELELVGGKSCVCGGCRVARYCSRECQVAHYKHWHKAVCKRLQAQRQQPRRLSE